jgi:hypothetical protein
MPSTYNEPTVMWRMRRGERLAAYALITPLPGPGVIAVYFVNDHPMRMRQFEDWTDAIAWCGRLRDQCWTTGWRSTSDDGV